jgi:DNA-directed RNA polymerase subunit H (RpoH/RPB5)
VRLSRSERESVIESYGITKRELERVRSEHPRARLVEAAKLAFRIDDEPNSDLIEFIAGYSARGGTYHHYRSIAELRNEVISARRPQSLPVIEAGSGELDLLEVIPHEIESYEVHVENGSRQGVILVWQKVNGGMRKVTINRVIPRITFLAGVLLYACEGTKSLASARVEFANSDPGIHRTFSSFLKSLGIPLEELKLRVQIHSANEEVQAKRRWVEALGVSLEQFTKPLLKAAENRRHRTTYTLQVNYQNTMLLMLLRAWTANLENILALGIVN